MVPFALALALGISLTVAGPAQATEWGVISGTFPGNEYDIRVDSTTSAYSIPANTIGNTYYAQVPVGDYTLTFEQRTDPTVAQFIWSGDTPDESLAQIVHVSANQQTDLDFNPPAAGSVSGTVNYVGGATNESYVSAFRLDPNGARFNHYADTDVAGDGTYQLGGLPDGSYLIRFRGLQDSLPTSIQYADHSAYIFASDIKEVTAGTDIPDVDGTLGPGGVFVARIGGEDRFAVSAALSSGFAPGVDAAFIVNGLNFPDALSAGAAAAHLEGPVLLTLPTSLPESISEELTRLAPHHIYIVGGVASVSAAVEAQLDSFAPGQVSRMNGIDRYEASRNVAAALFPSASVAYLANGGNFPDALAAVPAASGEKAPVILVNGSLPQLDSATAALLQSLGVTKVIIAGGPGSVSDGLEASLALIPGVEHVGRDGGIDRYAAALSINSRGFDLADSVFLSTGLKFPDALSGGPVAAALLAPIDLVQPDCIPTAVLDQMSTLGVKDIYILGGTGTLSDNVENLGACGG